MENTFYLHPEPWGPMIQFDFCIFFHRVETNNTRKDQAQERQSLKKPCYAMFRNIDQKGNL